MSTYLIHRKKEPRKACLI